MTIAPLPNLFPGVSRALDGAALRIVSNGLGVQSVPMLLMADLGIIGPRPDVAITADTDDETTAALENLAFLRSANIALSIPIAMVANGSLRKDFDAATLGQRKRLANPPLFIRNDDGSRGILSRGCTRDYKITPINREVRRLLGLGPRSRLPRRPVVEMWIGITTDEAHRMAPSRQPHIEHRYPLIEIGFSRGDCENWMLREYGFVPGSSGCVRCPFRDEVEWLSMQRNYPDDFEVACQADEAARHGIPNVRQPAFLHDSLRPLRSIDFAAEVARQQGTMFSRREYACGGGSCFT